MKRQRFTKHLRLRSSQQFKEVFDNRCSAADSHLVLYSKPNGLAFARLGLAVGRKYGSAVQRNLFKRRIREAFRLSMQELPAGCDLVVLPRLNRSKPSKTKPIPGKDRLKAKAKPAKVSMETYRCSLIQLCQKLHNQDRRCNTGN